MSNVGLVVVVALVRTGSMVVAEEAVGPILKR
jgi:hypothetical protein